MKYSWKKVTIKELTDSEVVRKWVEMRQTWMEIAISRQRIHEWTNNHFHPASFLLPSCFLSEESAFCLINLYCLSTHYIYLLGVGKNSNNLETEDYILLFYKMVF